MNKKIIKTLLLSMCCINMLSAAPLLTAFPPFVKAEINKGGTKKANTGFTNFSGVWETDGCGGDFPGTFTIRQDDDYYFEMDSSVTPIGVLLTEAQSGHDTLTFRRPESSIHALSWNSDKTKIIFRGVSVSKPYDNTNSSRLEPMGFHIQYNTLEFNKEGQLILKFKGISLNDLKLAEEWKPVTCVCHKIADVPEMDVKKARGLNALRK